MIDAMDGELYPVVGLSPETLRARARCRRETAARLWDEWLEQLLLDEAEELERRAAALDLGTGVRVEETDGAGTIVEPDLAAPREEAKAG